MELALNSGQWISCGPRSLPESGRLVYRDGSEGHWNPKNRINWVTLSDDGRPRFYGTHVRLP